MNKLMIKYLNLLHPNCYSVMWPNKIAYYNASGSELEFHDSIEMWLELMDCFGCSELEAMKGADSWRNSLPLMKHIELSTNTEVLIYR
jgi:hypothetical protein